MTSHEHGPSSDLDWDMDNAECARALGIEPKAASIRYVRALERLQKKLVQYTEFQN